MRTTTTTRSDIEIDNCIDEAEHQQQQHPCQRQQTQPLPIPIFLLFVFDGISLSLPGTVLLYIINTRVQLPIQLIPSYSAISFLPCSLKPLLAYITNSILLYNNKNNNDSRAVIVEQNNRITFRRYHLLSFLMFCNALCTLGTCTIPTTTTTAPGVNTTNTTSTNIGYGILGCYLWGFLRGLFNTWPEYLLQWTIIDYAMTTNNVSQATAIPATTTSTTDEEEEILSQQQQHDQTATITRAATVERQSSTDESNRKKDCNDNNNYASFGEIVALYQSQSAMARSIGCFIAYSINAIILSTYVLNNKTANCILILTAMSEMTASIVAYAYQIGYISTNHTAATTAPTNNTDTYDSNSSNNRSTNNDLPHTNIDDEFLQPLLLPQGTIKSSLFLASSTMQTTAAKAATTVTGENTSLEDADTTARPFEISTTTYGSSHHSNSSGNHRSGRNIFSCNVKSYSGEDNCWDPLASTFCNMNEIDPNRKQQQQEYDDYSHRNKYYTSDSKTPLLLMNNRNMNHSSNDEDDNSRQSIHHQRYNTSDNNYCKSKNQEFCKKDKDNNPHTSNRMALRIVVSMQICLILLIIRQPMRLFMTASSSSQSSSFEIMKLMRYGWWIIFVSIILYFIYFILQILLKDNICFDKLSNKNKNNTKNSNMSWNRSYNIGIFLIIRNAMPTSSYVFLSYIYTVFATTPVLLQIFSIINTIITTMSCWLYGKLLSRYHTSRATTKSDNDNNSNAIENNGAKYRQFKLVIVGTTILACLASLLNLIFVHMFSTTPSKSSTSTNQLPFVQKVIWTLIINAIITFTSEFMFMPDVVLATLASVDDDIDDIDKGDDYQKEYNYTSDRVVCRCVVVRDEVSTTMPCEDIMSTQTSLLETSRSEKNDIANDKDESTVYLTVQHEDEEQRQQQCRHVNDDDDEEEVLEDDTSNEHTNQNYDTMMIGSKYSSLISCIDFGGQIGALIIGPIISIIGTSRENNWEHIDHFIIICSIAMLFPLLFLRMIR